VPLDVLVQASEGLRRIDDSLAIHIHVAEQLREVQACERHSGRRPIELLLQKAPVDAHWCVVHATHASRAELTRLAATGAVVCVCPSTEGNLGDGFFDAQRWHSLGGSLAIGSDSEVTVNPAEELRWLEYAQRLRRRRRAVLTREEQPHVGAALWRQASISGARALDQPVGELAVGRRADWLVLDEDHPALAGAVGDAVLDRLVFGHASSAIRDVMVGGRWVVRDHRHIHEAAIAARFAESIRELRVHTAE
jgi:formimidoylglutamate deiminase